MNTTTNQRFDVAEIETSAASRWPEIITALYGIPVDALGKPTVFARRTRTHETN